jgi:hypothetical protein
MRFTKATAVVASIVAGCHLIGGTDGLVIVEGSSAASGGATVGSTGSDPSGSTGGADAMCTDALCMAQASECETCECLQGIVCDCTPVGFGQACTDGYCDSDGTCVPCIDNDQYGCAEPLTCIAKTCVAASCEDTIHNADETDLDCGGSCPPCANGDDCKNNGDCLSALCSQLLCTACNMHSECGVDRYCEGNVCFPKKETFGSCDEDYQCLSNNCVCPNVCGGCY